ncbi:putative exonuclease VIII, ds DNA exonuclease domain protein, partial [Escherichia coli EC4448]
LPSETMIWQPEFTDKTLSRKPGAVQTDAVETAIPDNEKTECKVEVEPSVEREGPFYFLFTDKDGEKYGRANKLSG